MGAFGALYAHPLLSAGSSCKLNLGPLHCSNHAHPLQSLKMYHHDIKQL